MFSCAPGSVVGIANGYGLDGLGIDSQWGVGFPHLCTPALGPTQPPVQWVPGFSRGKIAAKAWRWILTPLQCQGHESIQLYLYSLYGLSSLYRASVPVQQCTLTYSLYTASMPVQRCTLLYFLCFHPLNHNHYTKEHFICNLYPVSLCALFNPLQHSPC
jgi:hypothetical protein